MLVIFAPIERCCAQKANTGPGCSRSVSDTTVPCLSSLRRLRKNCQPKPTMGACEEVLRTANAFHRAPQPVRIDIFSERRIGSSSYGGTARTGGLRAGAIFIGSGDRRQPSLCSIIAFSAPISSAQEAMHLRSANTSH
jgi:hypothetical protein